MKHRDNFFPPISVVNEEPFFKMGHPRPVFRFIFVFSSKHYNFYSKNICEKMPIQYMVPGFELTTFKHESLPITTRPRIPSRTILLLQFFPSSASTSIRATSKMTVTTTASCSWGIRRCRRRGWWGEASQHRRRHPEGSAPSHCVTMTATNNFQITHLLNSCKEMTCQVSHLLKRLHQRTLT